MDILKIIGQSICRQGVTFLLYRSRFVKVLAGPKIGQLASARGACKTLSLKEDCSLQELCSMVTLYQPYSYLSKL
jgi:hypothetical protein